jgi:transposase-like protein
MRPDRSVNPPSVMPLDPTRPSPPQLGNARKPPSSSESRPIREVEKRIRPHLRPITGSWGVDETYVRVKGRWMDLYRAVDSRGQTTDFPLSARRDAEAAKRFFRKALGQPHTVKPRTITVDKNPAHPCATAEMIA